MTLRFRDFAPTDEADFSSATRSYGDLKLLRREMNAWVERTSARVLNVETLLVPGRPGKGKMPTTSSVGSALSGDIRGSTRWFQVVRVWYRDAAEGG